MVLRKLCSLLFVSSAVSMATAVPAGATDYNACGSKIFNACFYSEPVFEGTEYRTTIYYHGCYTLPPSRSYHTDIAATVYSESDCTGQSAEIFGYFGFDIGFTARSYRYPPA